MEKVYKIKAGSEKRVAFRDLSGLALGGLIFTIVVTIAFISANHFSLRDFLFFPIILSAIGSVMLFHMSYHYGFFIKVNKRTSFTVNDNSLSKNLDIDTREFGFWQQVAWRTFSRNNPIHVTINWNEVKSVSLRKYSLKIKSYKTNIFTGKGIIVLPKEIEDFEELKDIIEKKAGQGVDVILR